MSNRITDKDSGRIKILAMTGRYTPQEIATYFEDRYTPEQVIRHLSTKDPESKEMLKKEKSRGAVRLKDILTKIFPGVSILEEYHIGNRLRLDFYIKEPYNLGFEFDGVQHSKQTDFLHSSEEDFFESKNRDIQKEDLCKGRGINLVRIDHSENMSEELVRQKIDNISYGSGEIQDGFQTPKEIMKKKRRDQAEKASEHRKEKYKEYKNSEVHKKHKLKHKQARKAQYQRQKEWLRQNVKKR